MEKHFFLFSCMVVFQRDNLERLKRFNVLAQSEKQIITTTQLGRAQQEVQVRFHQQFNRDEKSEVVDVYIEGISHLGYMTDAEFHDLPKEEPDEEAIPVDDLSAKVANDAATLSPHAGSSVDPYRTGASLGEISQFGTDDAGKSKDKDHGSTDE